MKMNSIKRIFTTISFVIVMVTSVFGQHSSRSVERRLKNAETATKRTGQEIQTLRRELESTRSRVDSLREQTMKADEDQISATQQLSDRGSDAQASSDQELRAVQSSVGRTFFYSLASLVGVFALTGIAFLFQRHTSLTHTRSIESEIGEIRISLQAEVVQLDNRLLELLERQIKSDRRETDAPPVQESDHSLALRVADEIVRIQKNLSAMDPSIRGHKQLVASTKRIQDTFAANGYEIIEMLNRPYNDGMRVVANFRPDDRLGEDEQIITRIIKPQVNFGGTMIQAGQVEVSQG